MSKEYPVGVAYQEGGPGSGNFGHAGRPGRHGGSMPGGGKHTIGVIVKGGSKEHSETGERFARFVQDELDKTFGEKEKRIETAYKKTMNNILGGFEGREDAQDFANMGKSRRQAAIYSDTGYPVSGPTIEKALQVLDEHPEYKPEGWR